MDPKKDLLWLIGLFIVVWFIWFVTGGPYNPSARKGPYLTPPTSESTTGEVYGSRNNNGDTTTISPLHGSLVIGKATRGYVMISANPSVSESLPVTGLRILQTPNGLDAIIPEGYRIGNDSYKEPITLHDGDSLVLVYGNDEGPQKQGNATWVAYLNGTVAPQGGILLLDTEGKIIDSATY
jgi:hypothetical protein